MSAVNMEDFLNPPVLYRPSPLWIWNDEMTEDLIRQQLKELKSHGFGTENLMLAIREASSSFKTSWVLSMTQPYRERLFGLSFGK